MRKDWKRADKTLPRVGLVPSWISVSPVAATDLGCQCASHLRIKCELVLQAPPPPESGGSGHRHTLSPATPHGPPASAATSPVNAPAGRWKGGVGRVLRGPRVQKLALSCSTARRAQAGGSAEPGGAPTEIAPGSKEGRSPPRCGQERDSRRWTQLEISWAEWESGPR